MSIFWNIGNIAPDIRERSARAELRLAEAAYEAAEDRLIKARRAYDEATREWRNFYKPYQTPRS